jgi:pilus assembly protein FimV
MLRSLGPTLLTPILALPSASLALGLGDIHVESALHQPLVAQIDLIGATSDDLARLNGGIASDEIFQRYGLERPSFLAGTALVVGQDKQGRPILILRSTERLTEPAVTFLVDLHSPSGELIREYTVLLDPPGLASEPGGLKSVPSIPVPAVVAERSSVIARPERAVTTPDSGLPLHMHIVAPGDTLDRIAGIAGAHSNSDRHRMMIAIFRANPGAFQTNVNFLRRGATLHLPNVEQLSAISTEDANREYSAQMSAWRASNHRLPQAAAAAVTVSPNSIVSAKPDTAPDEADRSVLKQRVESLEQSLEKLRQELQQQVAIQPSVPVAVGSVPATDPTPKQSQLEHQGAPAWLDRMPFAPLALGFGVVFAAGAWIHRRRRKGDNLLTRPRRERNTSIGRGSEEHQSVAASNAMPPFPQAALGASPPVEKVKSEAEHASAQASDSESGWFRDIFSTRISDLLTSEPAATLATAGVHAAKPATRLAAAPRHEAEGAVILSPDLEAQGDTVEQKFGFFNPESNANTTHVIMGSALSAPPTFVERRKNPADVLRQAIEREPDRSDLRLKLLELYYMAAAENRRAFVELTRQLAKNEKLASAEDWSRIIDMGRAIAPDDELFSDGLDDQAVA